MSDEEIKRATRIASCDPNCHLNPDAKDLINNYRAQTISREQFSIQETNRGYKLYDLGSNNGTYLNNKKIFSEDLTIGDKIRAADETFLYSIVQ